MTTIFKISLISRYVQCILYCTGPLTHWGQVTHICVNKLAIIGSDNGLLPGWHQAIIWTNDGILLTGTLGTNLSEILSEIHTFSFKKMHLKMTSAKWRPFCLGLNVLNVILYQCISEVLAPNSARRSAGTILTTKLNIFLPVLSSCNDFLLPFDDWRFHTK